MSVESGQVFVFLNELNDSEINSQFALCLQTLKKYDATLSKGVTKLENTIRLYSHH